MSNQPKIGTVVWTDLTVSNAKEVKDFYTEVMGVKSSDVNMGEYSDYTLIAPNEKEVVAGVCHARGENADLPSQWLVYFQVEDVDVSAQKCKEMGGKVIAGPRELGEGRFCVVQDPAGAVAALYSD